MRKIKTSLLLAIFIPVILFSQTNNLPDGDVNIINASVATVSGKDSLFSNDKNQRLDNPSDTRLESLSLGKVKLDNFKNDSYNYRYYLPYSAISALEISALSFNPKAKITVLEPSNIKGSLKERTALIKVTSQDGSNSV